MKVLTYNIQSGMGMDGVRDIARAAQVICSSGADVTGLQEIEMGSPRSRFQNQPARIAELTGMHLGFVHGMQRGPWRFGNSVLSRFPILSCKRIPLWSRGEQRSLLASQLDTGAELMNFFCTHLGLDGEERVRQGAEIATAIDSVSGPVVLVGDFNEQWDAPAIQGVLRSKGLSLISGHEATYPSDRPTAAIDYVFARGMPQPAACAVVHTQVSDHLPVMVEFSGN